MEALGSPEVIKEITNCIFWAFIVWVIYTH
jgi:hypothetical protein